MTTITINVPDGYMFESHVNEVIYQFDPAKMVNAALLYLVEYGAQRAVNDRCGGSDKTDDDKAKIAKATIDRLTSPDFTERAPRGSGDPLVPYIRTIVRLNLKAKGGDAWKAYKAAKEADARNAMLDAIIAKQSEATISALRTQATADKAKADAERKRLADDAAKLVNKHGLTI